MHFKLLRRSKVHFVEFYLYVHTPRYNMYVRAFSARPAEIFEAKTILLYFPFGSLLTKYVDEMTKRVQF